MRTAFIAVACVLLNATPALVQSRPAADPVDAVVRQLERVINAKDRTAFPALFDPVVSKDLVTQHSYDLFLPGAVRTALFERSRGPLEGVPAGDGFRLVIEFFMETPGRARIVTAGIDIRRPPGGDAASWRMSPAMAQSQHRIRPFSSAAT